MRKFDEGFLEPQGKTFPATPPPKPVNLDWSKAFLPDLWKWEKEDRRLAGQFLEKGDHPAAIRFLAMAEEKEEVIQTKLATVDASWGFYHRCLFHLPDSERVYLTKEERSLAQDTAYQLRDSEYVRRHPEMVEGAYVLGLDSAGALEIFREEL